MIVYNRGKAIELILGVANGEFFIRIALEVFGWW
jgi:hypothetical protein